MPEQVLDTCPQGHEYTEENTYVTPSTGKRTCRKCNAKRDRKRDSRRNRQRFAGERVDETMTPAQTQRERVFMRDAGGFHGTGAELKIPWCLAAQTLPDHECSGQVQCAHALPKASIRDLQKRLKANSRTTNRKLRDADIDDVIYDERAAFTLCAGGHEAWDKLGKRCDLAQLPQHVRDWAREWGLRDRLREYYKST